VRVSLATFHLFDRENLNWPGVGVVAAAARVARVARVPGERAATAGAKSHDGGVRLKPFCGAGKA
jgi:hypothetical protein